MDEELFGAAAVFISEPLGTGTGRWRSRRQPQQRVSSWHLIHAERALTWCGRDISYRDPRRPWSEIREDQRCQSCLGRLERVTHAHASQRTQ